MGVTVEHERTPVASVPFVKWIMKQNENVPVQRLFPVIGDRLETTADRFGESHFLMISFHEMNSAVQPFGDFVGVNLAAKGKIPEVKDLIALSIRFFIAQAVLFRARLRTTALASSKLLGSLRGIIPSALGRHPRTLAIRRKLTRETP